MRKLLFAVAVMVFVFILSACSSNDNSEGNNESQQNNQENEEKTGPEPETLYTYIHEDFGEENRHFEFNNLQVSEDASTIQFTEKEKEKREETKTAYVIYGDNDAEKVINLSDTDGEERDQCYFPRLSSNGKFIRLDCKKDDNEFSIYDFESGEVVHHEEKSDDRDMIGESSESITDDMEVVHSTHDEEIIIHNLEEKETEEYSFIDLTGEDDAQINGITSDADGDQFLIAGHHKVYFFDRDNEELTDLADVDTLRDEHETDDLRASSVIISSNGKYGYFKITDKASDPLYESDRFINFESGEVTGYTDFDYDVESLDDEGKALLNEVEGTYLYNIDDSKMVALPDFAINPKRLTLSGNGEHIVYADSEEDPDNEDNQLYKIMKLDLEDMDQYEEVDIEGDEEDLHETKQDTDGDKENDNDLAMDSPDEDIKSLFKEKWEDSANSKYPTEFPAERRSTSYHIHDHNTRSSYGMTVKFEDRMENDDIEYSVYKYKDNDSDQCISDDLELEKSEDGIDYYFEIFNDKEAELAFEKDDLCYVLEGDNYEKKDMFNIVDSLKTDGKHPEDLPIEDVMFPEKLPIEDVYIQNYHVSHHGENNYVYSVDYRGEGDDELKIDYHIGMKEPDNFGDEDKMEAVDMDNDMEAYYNDEYRTLHLSEDDVFYEIKADISNRKAKDIGEDGIQDILQDVGESLEK